MKLDQKQKKFFQENGYLVIKDFFNIQRDILPIQKEIYEVIKLVINKYKIETEIKAFNTKDFHLAYQDVLKDNREAASEIYDSIKNIFLFRKLSLTKN